MDNLMYHSRWLDLESRGDVKKEPLGSSMVWT